jgi:hypothetical protein
MPKEVYRRRDEGGQPTDIILSRLDGLVKAAGKDVPCNCQAGLESEFKGLQPDVLYVMKAMPRDAIRGIRARLKEDPTPERSEVFEGLLTAARKPVIDGKIFPYGDRSAFCIMETLGRIFDPHVDWSDRSVAGGIMQKYRSFMCKATTYPADVEYVLRIEAEKRLKGVDSIPEQERIKAILDRQLISRQQYSTLVALRTWFRVAKDKTMSVQDIAEAMPNLEKAGLCKEGRLVADAGERINAMLSAIPRRYLRDDFVTDLLDEGLLKIPPAKRLKS